MRKKKLLLIVLGVFVFLGCIYTGLYEYISIAPYYANYLLAPHYSGRGIVKHFSNHCDNEACAPGVWSKALQEYRDVIVYLPPTYDPSADPYPLVIALHGNRADENSFGRTLPDLIDSAILRGDIPPVVMIAPDFSIGGAGEDDPQTPFDDRLGSFYINSNVGRFEDYFLYDFLPWAKDNFNVSLEKEKTILLGQSMGGFGVFSLGIRHPEISTILVGIYPALDIRYSCNGNKLSDFDITCYAPLNTDDPERISMSALRGLITQTEKDSFYAVFNSDSISGDVWTNDRPVWERIRDYNPVDLMRNGYEINGIAIYIIAGKNDEFNIDAQVEVFASELSTHNYTVSPEIRIIEGHHTLDFVINNMPNIFKWIGQQLRYGSQVLR